MNLIKAILPICFFIGLSTTLKADAGGGFITDIAAYQGKASSTSEALAGATAINISVGTGLGGSYTNNFTKDGFNAASYADAETNRDFIQFEIKAAAGKVIEITEIQLKYSRSSDGPTHIALRSSKDSYAADIFSDGSVSTSAAAHAVQLSNGHQIYVADGDDITFRIYGWGASSSTGTFSIDSTLDLSLVTFLSLADVGIIVKGSVYDTGNSNVGFISTLEQAFETNTSTIVMYDVAMTEFEGDEVILSVAATNLNSESGDYSLVTNSLTFNGNDTQKVVLQINHDADYDDEGLRLNLTESTTTGITINSDSLQILIYDDDSPPHGLQVSATNTAETIDFDNTKTYVNQGAYQGLGLASSPSNGQLNSLTWSVGTINSQITIQGGSYTTGDFAHGIDDGAVSDEGLYAFEVEHGNYAFGVQPASTTFNPGNILLAVQNKTGGTVNTLRVIYEMWVFNDQDKSATWDLQLFDNAYNSTSVNDLSFLSTATADGSPEWKKYLFVADVSLTVADDEYFRFYWTSSDAGGSGGMDQFALDNITVIMNPTGNYSIASGEYEGLYISATTCDISSGNVTINDKIHNTGTINIESGASLVQTSSSNTNSGGGTYNIKRTLTGVSDTSYNYWSSPVTSTTMNTVFPNSNSSHFYYYDATKNIDKDLSWRSQNGASTMTPGVGYITTPATGSNNATVTHTFNGTINNGTINGSVSYFGTVNDGDNDWNLMGNPYPSSIDFEKWATTNSNMNTTMYLWFSDSGYFSYTAGSGGNPAYITRYVASCQSFFVTQKSSPNTIQFLNDHRAEENSARFYKNDLADMSRFWLGAHHESGIYSELLIAFNDEAAWGYEDFDGTLLEGSDLVEIGTKVGTEILETSAIPNLQPNEVRVIPIVFITFDSANFTFKMDSLQNIPAHLKLYLKDNHLDSIIDIKTKEYQFSTYHIGYDRNRFELILDTRWDQVEDSNDPFSIGGASPTNDQNVSVHEVTANEFNLKNQPESWLLTCSSTDHSSTWNLFDISGKVLGQYQMQSGILNIPKYHLTEGIYLISNGTNSFKLVR